MSKQRIWVWQKLTKQQLAIVNDFHERRRPNYAETDKDARQSE